MLVMFGDAESRSNPILQGRRSRVHLKLKMFISGSLGLVYLESGSQKDSKYLLPTCSHSMVVCR